MLPLIASTTKTWRWAHHLSYRTVKKVILADGIAEYVGPVFNAPSAGVQLTFIEAWGGALCYTLQLYFDFSGYSDMQSACRACSASSCPLNFSFPIQIVEHHRVLAAMAYFTVPNTSGNIYIHHYTCVYADRFMANQRWWNCCTALSSQRLLFPNSWAWHGASWNYVIFGGMHGVFDRYQPSLAPNAASG